MTLSPIFFQILLGDYLNWSRNQEPVIRGQFFFLMYNNNNNNNNNNVFYLNTVDFKANMAYGAV